MKDKKNWVWWKHGVFYQIYPRSFYDSDNDGIGDINGIIEKLDYLAELGIDAIWLSPIYKSPKIDFGYDVSDYKSIDSDYGSFDDFRTLLSVAHSKNIRVIMDLIMNHTSDKHPWFIESKSAEDNPKRDWYIWQKGSKNKKPNNWKSSFGNSAWQFDENTQSYYLHSFFKEQPDLNWRNKDMAKTFFEEIKFWLELGVDGFRLDVINMIVKDKKFRNNPFMINIPFLQNHKYSRNRPKSYKIVEKLRKLIDTYEDRVLIGEIYVMPPGDPKLSASYLSTTKDRLHLTFDFSLMFQKWNALKYYQCIKKSLSKIPDNAWACNVLSNHDLKRSFNRIPHRLNKTEKAKIEAVLLLSLKGSPFIYYGEEIGMKNSLLKYSHIKDPLGKRYWPLYNGRDGARTPMQWDSSKNAGFSENNPWLPVNADYKIKNLENQQKDENSIYNVYARLIKLRKKYPSLQKGSYNVLHKGENGVFAYCRKYNDECIIVVLNFTNKEKNIDFEVAENKILLFSTHNLNPQNLIGNNISVLPFEASIYLIN